VLTPNRVCADARGNLAQVLWQRVHYEDGVPHATALPSALGCSSIKVTAEHLGFYLQVVLGILMDVNLGATVLLKTKSAVVAAAPGETPSDMDVAKNSSGNKELERKKSLEMQEHTSQRRQQALQKLRKSVRNVVKMNNVVSNMARREVMTSKKTSGKSKERRVGISAQPSNGLHVDAAKTQPLVRHAKSEAVRALLTKVLAKHFLFSQLNKGSLSEMVDFMFHIYVPQGHAVVNQVRSSWRLTVFSADTMSSSECTRSGRSRAPFHSFHTLMATAVSPGYLTTRLWLSRSLSINLEGGGVWGGHRGHSSAG
jgi:hypothetical protein